MAIPQRVARMNELLKEEIGKLIHDELNDPRIGFATVITVEASHDFKNAHVYVSVLGSEKEKEQTLSVLNKSKGFIQTELGRTLSLKYVPIIKFERDDTADASMRISEILNRISKEKSERSETE